MQPGPKPKPTKLKILAGNPGKRPLPENEPQPPVPGRLPRAPAYLDKAGKAEWRRMGKELHKLGLLSALDLTAFGCYCNVYATWANAVEAVQEDGVLIILPDGDRILNPYFAIQNKAATEMRRWLTEFGCTPSSRSRVSIDVEEFDPMEDFLNQKR